MHNHGLSIVVCTYNRKKFILNCLRALDRQTLNKEKFEIIVVDNNSTDDSSFIINDFIKLHPQLHCRYVFVARKGLAFARNQGIAHTKYGLVTYIDDDTETTPEFAETILNFMQLHPEVAGVGGRVLPLFSESDEPAWISKYLAGFLGIVDYGLRARLYKRNMKYPAGCNMTYRKELIIQVGGFNNKLTFRSDDKQIYYSIRKLNHAVYYLPEAVLYHNIDAARLQFASFKKVFIETGRGEYLRVSSGQGSAAIVLKLSEYLCKFGASLAIWLLFCLKGKEFSGRYVAYSQWYTLKGFFTKNVHAGKQ